MQQAGPSGMSESIDLENKEKKGMEEPQQPLSPNALKLAAADCLNSWIYYLQVRCLCLTPIIYLDIKVLTFIHI